MNYQDALIAGLRGEISALEAQLAAAREENERLSNRLSDAQLANDKLRGQMFDLREDHDYVVGNDWMQKATDAQRALAALRARADDAGRVERVAEALVSLFPEYEAFDDDDMAEYARAVLAAADST